MHSGDNENQVNDTNLHFSPSNKTYNEELFPSDIQSLKKSPSSVYLGKTASEPKFSCEALLTLKTDSCESSQIARFSSETSADIHSSSESEEEDLSESSALLGSDVFLKGKIG